MDIWQFVTLVAVPSGIFGAIAGGIVTYFSTKKLDIHRRTMEARKSLYTKLHERLSKFYSTVSEKESDEHRDRLLKYYREIQIWGSDEVVRNFTELLETMVRTLNSEEKEVVDKRNHIYKKFVISMRKDILSETSLFPEDIVIRGIKK